MYQLQQDISSRNEKNIQRKLFSSVELSSKRIEEESDTES